MYLYHHIYISQPVMDWLTAYNAAHNPNDEGWTDECPTDLPEVGSR